MNSDVGEPHGRRSTEDRAQRDRTRSRLPPVKAERRESADGTVLYVDPIALAALELAKASGMTRAADIASLPSSEELPLRVVVAETRIEILERELLRLRVERG